MVQVSANQDSRKREKSIDALCARYGIDAPMPRDMGGLEPLEDSPLYLAERTRDDLVHCYEQADIGVVGTRIFAGRIRSTDISNFTPTVVRGTGSNAGLYEEYRQSESMIYDSLVGISELVASAPPKVRMPKSVRRSQAAQLERWVAAQDAAIQNLRCMEGGWRKFATEAMSQACFGFATFERAHSLTPAGWVWSGAQPRLQSTVDRWIMSAESDDLVGVEYRANPGYGNTTTYILPAVAMQPWDVRVLLFRIGSYGIDWEGTPPTRPSLHWVKFKRLIAQIVPAAAEKYGVPITYIMRDPAFMSLVASGALASSLPDMDDAYDAFVDSLSQDLPVHKFGEGIIASTIAPPGQMPTLETWIQYCDQMIAYPFSNEGNLLGLQSSSGSYAQAEVRERRFLRSAPYYQCALTDPINEQILKPLARAQFGDLLEYPVLELSASRMSDNSKWIADARSLFGPNLPVEQWPSEFRNIAYEKMGVRPEGIQIVEDGVPDA